MFEVVLHDIPTYSIAKLNPQSKRLQRERQSPILEITCNIGTSSIHAIQSDSYN